MKHNDKPKVWRDILEVLAAFAVFGFLLWLFLAAVRSLAEYAGGWYAPKKMKADTVNEEDGAGRVTASVGVISRSMAEAPAEEEETALWVYVEGEGTPPEWWNPDEEMAVEWYDEDLFLDAAQMVEAEPHPPVGISQGGIDWNVESAIYGWDGHTMTGLELDLFSRIAYLEVWGSSDECCKAVVDAILVLWDEQYFGRTMFETLSAVTESGSYAFSTFPWVWTVDYDVEGLNEMRELCLGRFMNGYEYTAPFFRTDYFHPWAVDGYVIENVYFSYSPWG